MRCPCGDQFGCTPSVSVNWRVAPVLTFTTQSRAPTPRLNGFVPTLSEEYTISFWSGDHAGLAPEFVSRFTDSPVAPITKMPPPFLFERNAIDRPSGEKAGCVSTVLGSSSFIRLIGFSPPTL